MVFTAAFVAMKNACCAAGSPAVDYEAIVRCDPAGNSILVVSAIDTATGIPTPTAYNLDGSLYAGAIGDLGACDTPEIESDPVEMCDAGTVNFLRWFIKQDGAIIGSVDTDISGAPYGPSGPVAVGICATAVETNKQLTYLDRLSGTSDVPAIMAATGAVHLYSVTLQQISGTGSVTGDSGNTIPLYAGETLSWSAVILDLENLNASALTFDSGGGEMHVTALYSV